MRVYKFMAAEPYHLEALNNNQVYFSNLSELNDPYEGLLHFSKIDVTKAMRLAAHTHQLNATVNNLSKARREAETMLKRLGEKNYNQFLDNKMSEFFEVFLQHHRNSRFVLSLSHEGSKDEYPHPLTSMMMWAHYAKGMRGMCVEYDFTTLQQSIEKLNPDTKLTIKRVTYNPAKLPEVKATTMLDDMAMRNGACSKEILQAFCTKLDSWKYESELRMINTNHGLAFVNKDAIKRVFVSSLNEKLIEDVKSLLVKRDNRPELHIVHTQKVNYGFGFEKIVY